MKLFWALFLVFTYTLFSQVAIKNQPVVGFYDQINQLTLKKTPSEEDLLKMKQISPPSNMDQILKSFDWIDAGNFHYTENTFSLDYKKESSQYHFHRFNADGGKLDFSINSPNNGGSVVNHTNFDNPPHIKWNVVKIKGKFYIEEDAYGEKSYLRIIHYADGVLVIDISMNGKINEKANFRSVMISIPKMFEWKFGE